MKPATIILGLLLAGVSLVYADAVPVFNVAAGTMASVSGGAAEGGYAWSFSGSGFNLEGTNGDDATGPTLPGEYSAGQTISPDASIGLPNVATGTLNGVSYADLEYFGTLDITGAPIAVSGILPSTFVEPVDFNGSLTFCGPSFDACDSGFRTNEGVIDFNLPGTVTLDIELDGVLAAGPVYSVAQVSYDVTPPDPPAETPEPGSLALFGSGLAAVSAFLRRRRLIP